MDKKSVVKIVLPFIFFFLFTGCQSFQEIFTKTVPSDEESLFEVGHGNLKDKIGTDSMDHSLPSIHPEELHFLEGELAKNIEYNESTGKWFEGNLGYDISTGIYEPGEPYFVRLISHEKEGTLLNRELRIQLTERNHKLEKVHLHHEFIFNIDKIEGTEEIFTNLLPNKENAIYLLSVEILDEKRNIEDTMITMIYTPSPEMNVQLELDKTDSITPDDTIVLIIKNYGPTFLTFGKHYSFEKEIDGIWRIVPLDLSFEEIGIMLKPKDTYEQMIELKDLSKGKYRIIKQVYGEGIDQTATLAIEFFIE